MAYRIEIITSQDATWIFVPLGVVTYVAVVSASVLANAPISNVEFTAGILVCCMPTTTAVFKELKSSVASLASSYRTGFRSTSTPGATDRYELNSTTNLKLVDENQGSQGNREGTKGVGDSSGRLELEGFQSSPHVTDSYPASEDAKIRKTTHIRITR